MPQSPITNYQPLISTRRILRGLALTLLFSLAACLPPLEPLPTPLVMPTSPPASATATLAPTEPPTPTEAPTLTATPAPSATASAAEAPRRDYEILYTEDGLPKLVGSDGEHPRSLDLGFDDELTLTSISPDGNWLAYFTAGKIYTYNFLTGDPPAEFVEAAYVKALRWKPDSHTLYFAVYPRGGKEMGGGIWSYSFTDLAPVNHANSTEAHGDWRIFSFSPDGLLAAICPKPVEAGFNCDGLYILDIGLRLAQRVDLPRGCDPVYLTWSPDGARLAVGCNALLGVGASIYRVDPRGLTSASLSPKGTVDSAPAWSPDGTRLAFRSCIDRCEIWTMSADDGKQRQAVGTAIIGTGRLLWTPEEELLAAVRDERSLDPGLYRISPTTGGAVLLTPAKLARLMELRVFEEGGEQ